LILSPFSGMLHTLKRQYVPLALVVTLLLGSSLSAAAEEAVPGDKLYFLKTNVNEKVLSLVTLSSESEAELQATIAERRIKEVEKLALKGKLSTEVKVELEHKFQKHSDNAKAKIATLASQGKLDAAATIAAKTESSLTAHTNILKTISQSGKGGEDITSVTEKVEAEAAVVSTVRVTIAEKVVSESGTTTRTSAEEAKKAAEAAAVELTLAVNTNADLSPELAEESRAKLAIASSTLVEADSKIKAGEYAEAFILSQNTLKVLREIKIILATDKELNITGTTGLTPKGSDTGTSTAATSTSATGTSTSTSDSAGKSDNATTTIQGSGSVNASTSPATVPASPLRLRIQTF
jgi:hypothetical protein